MTTSKNPVSVSVPCEGSARFNIGTCSKTEAGDLIMHKNAIKYSKGEKIGSCTYLHDISRINGHRKAMFKCRCGKTFEALILNVKRGNTNSCGCHHKKMTSKARKIHGLSKSKEYATWARIVYRCYDKKAENYYLYGGRGIKICDEWRRDPVCFIEYMLKLPNAWEFGYSIDRINNNGNYEPGNVRWATAKQQANNRRKKNGEQRRTPTR